MANSEGSMTRKSRIYLFLSIVIVLVLTYISHIVIIGQFEIISRDSLNYLDIAHSENVDIAENSINTYLKKEQLDLLLKKVSVAEQYKMHHLDLIKKLSKNSYSMLTLFPFLSAVTAILVFLIIQKGWNSSNYFLKTHFILFTTLTSLVGIYPEVYEQTDSIEMHTESYLDYTDLQKTIFSYSLSAPIFEKDSVTFDLFLDGINTRERELMTIIFNLEKKSLDEGMFDSKLNN